MQASAVVWNEIIRIQEILKTTTDVEEKTKFEYRLEKCLQWFEDNKEILQGLVNESNKRYV